MGLPLLRDAFHELRATPVVLVIPSNGRTDDLAERLAEIVSRAEDRVGSWQRHMVRLMDEIPTASAIHLADGGTAAEIVTDLETLRAEVRDRLDRVVKLQTDAEAVAGATDADLPGAGSGQAGLVSVRSERMRNLMTTEIEASSRFLDFLTAFLADIDPDARGGPSFGDADELIAFLNG